MFIVCHKKSKITTNNPNEKKRTKQNKTKQNKKQTNKQKHKTNKQKLKKTRKIMLHF
jgi:1,2-phenylacetyl-CoA epoxidase PaaB subunit